MKKLVKFFEQGVGHKRVEEQFHIQHDNDRRGHPAKNFQPELVGELAHLRLFISEPQQRPDGKAELHGQHHLAGDEQLRGLAFTKNADDQNRGNDGDGSRDKPAQPWRNPNIQETFHHYLAGQGSGQSGVLSGREQRDCEKNAGETYAEKRTQQFVGVLNFRHVLMSGPMKHCRRENENRRIDEKREHQSAGRVDCCEFDRLTFALRRLFKFPRLHDRRVKIEIMWHDRRADDADADIKHLLIHDDVRTGHKTGQHTQEVWFGQDQLGREASGDGRRSA